MSISFGKGFEEGLNLAVEKGMTKAVSKFLENHPQGNGGKINFNAYWSRLYVKLIIIKDTDNDITPIKFVLNDDESKETMNNIDPNFLNKNFVVPAHQHREIPVGVYYRAIENTEVSKKAKFRMEYSYLNKTTEKDSFVDGSIVFSVNGS